MLRLKARRESAIAADKARRTKAVKEAPVKEPINYLMEGDEFDEAIAIVKQKIEAHRLQFGFTPIGFQIEMERLIEKKRIKSDKNFYGGNE